MLCEGINEGEIVIFDKAYVDFKHLWRLFQRGVFWITRAKDNMKYDVVGQHSAPKLNILRDVLIRLTGQRTSVWYPETLRLIEAIVEVDGKPKRMTFITDNFTWSPSSICDLYKARWAIEVFFKADQTDSSTIRLHGLQRKRDALANMDGSSDIYFTPLYCMAE